MISIIEPQIKQIRRIKNTELLYEDLSFQIISAAMTAHQILGYGFLEAVYEEAFAYELKTRNIQFERQKALKVKYKDIIAKEYIADFLVDDKIIVEIKAIKRITEIEEAQLQNYLKATGIRIGLLFNFGEKSLNYKRIIR